MGLLLGGDWFVVGVRGLVHGSGLLGLLGGDWFMVGLLLLGGDWFVGVR